MTDGAVGKIFLQAFETFKIALADKTLLRCTEKVAALIVDCLKAGGKVLVCGNGGSAADAQHFAAELVGSFMIKDRQGFAAISLTADSSVLTSLCNDMGVEKIFSRQVEALGRAGDVFVGITTSGRSKNILNALDTAKANGLRTVSLTGQLAPDAQTKTLSDITLEVPSTSTPRIQEVHALVIHAICELVEGALQHATCDTPSNMRVSA